MAKGDWAVGMLHTQDRRLITRRDIIAAVAGLAAWPAVTQAQQTVPVVGVLWPSSVETDAVFDAALKKGLRDAGYVEGRNVAFAMRYANGDLNRLPPLAAELAALRPRVIFAPTDAAALAAHAAAPDVPLVMLFGGDPIKQGLANSYARPGGMVTGVVLAADMRAAARKRLDILRELIPSIKRLAVMFHPDRKEELPTIENREAAFSLGIELIPLPVQYDVGALESAFADGVRQHADAFHVSGNFFNVAARIASLALSVRKPTMALAREFTATGILASYGADFLQLYDLLPTYIAKILSGARAGDLPIEQPTAYHFAINLKTAKTLGLTIPPTLLARADEVIE